MIVVKMEMIIGFRRTMESIFVMVYAFNNAWQ